MHLGVCIPYNSDSGGFAQYSLIVLKALADRPADFRNDAITIFGPEELRANHSLDLASQGLNFQLMPPSSFLAGVGRSIFGKGYIGRVLKRLRPRRKLRRMVDTDSNIVAPDTAVNRWWKKHNVDLLFFPIWSEIAVQTRIPYVMGIHDIEHRFQPHFPETQAFWDTYEYIVRNAARQSVFVIAESEVGRQDLLDCYTSCGLTPDRVAVVPYTAPPYLRLDMIAEEARRVRVAFDLPPQYLFYPARFWPHKNHAGLIEALGILKLRHNLQIPLVLVGSHPDPLTDRTFRDLFSVAQRVGVAEQIRNLGFAKNEDMTGLYANAVALVMPSFLGPTNIPPIEAWAVGCPVITSNIRGIREMCADAALLCDPGSPHSIAEAIARVWTDPEYRLELISRGHARFAKFSPQAFRDGVWEVLRRARTGVAGAAHPLRRIPTDVA